MSIPRESGDRRVRALRADDPIAQLPDTSGFRPVITLSRQCGSRGGEVGRLVAERLGFEFWPQELLHAAARGLGGPGPLPFFVDDRQRDAIGALMASISRGEVAMQPEYVRTLRRVVRAIALRGSAVLVGRGAQFVVETALRVRVVAPIEQRVQGYARRHRLSLERATARVREVDRERTAFLRQHFGQDIDDPRHYDLIVNTASMPLDEAADVLWAAYERRHGRAAAAAW